jgi:hypothetical protein
MTTIAIEAIPPSSFDWNRLEQWLRSVEDIRAVLELPAQADVEVEFDVRVPPSPRPHRDWNPEQAGHSPLRASGRAK